MATSRRDPAERRACLRLFYRDWRPTRLGRLVSGTLALLSRLSLTPPTLISLEVRGTHERDGTPARQRRGASERQAGRVDAGGIGRAYPHDDADIT